MGSNSQGNQGHGQLPYPSGTTYTQQPQTDIYTVDKILDRKKVGKKVMYYVKWDGYSEKEGTWEPIANLKNVKDMVKEFDAQVEK